MNDDELDLWLRRTHPRPVVPASFPRDVWARIAAAEADSPFHAWRRLGADFLGWLARPAPAVALVLGMLAVGVGAGKLTGGPEGSGHRQVYLASIDPLHPLHPAHSDNPR